MVYHLELLGIQMEEIQEVTKKLGRFEKKMRKELGKLWGNQNMEGE